MTCKSECHSTCQLTTTHKEPQHWISTKVIQPHTCQLYLKSAPRLSPRTSEGLCANVLHGEVWLVTRQQSRSLGRVDFTDILDDLDITLMGIKPKPREDKRTYLKAPYLITLECTFEQFGKFLSEIERSPRLITVDEFEVKNGIERIKANTEEDKLIDQEFVVALSTITLVKSKSKVSS